MSRQPRKVYDARYTIKNRAKKLASQKKYRAKNRQKICGLQKDWRDANPEKAREHRRSWERANPDKKLNKHLKHRYGITLSERDQMLIAQNMQCLGCEASFWDVQPCVDHCHSTGSIRGILCSPCNRALGFAQDNASTLRHLADYLDGSQAHVRQEREWTEQ